MSQIMGLSLPSLKKISPHVSLLKWLSPVYVWTMYHAYEQYSGVWIRTHDRVLNVETRVPTCHLTSSGVETGLVLWFYLFRGPVSRYIVTYRWLRAYYSNSNFHVRHDKDLCTLSLWSWQPWHRGRCPYLFTGTHVQTLDLCLSQHRHVIHNRM